MKKIILILMILLSVVYVKSQTLLSEGFENGIPATWLNVDADGDGYVWQVASFITDSLVAHSGDKSAISFSYDNNTVMALTPDNYLITSAITIPAQGATLTYWVVAQDQDWADEHYAIKVSTSGTSPANFTTVFQETISRGPWMQKTVSLSAYAGQTIYVAFVHTNSTDEFAIKFDDISIEAGNITPPPPPGYATIVLEAYDVWGDYSGYQILLDADAVEYPNMPGSFTCGGSYGAYEYKLPANANSSDSYVVYYGIDSMQIPAGIYDYVVLNPGCNDYSTIYIASSNCSPAMGDNFNFEAGRRYHFYMSLGDSNDCVTLTIDGNAPVVNTPVDLGVGFVDSNVTMYIDSMTVNYGSDFSPVFYLYNWDGTSPSQNDYNDTLYIGFTFNGVDSGLIGYLDYTDSILYIGDAESYTYNSFLTAAQIAAAGLLGGTYECCIYLSLDAGWTEQDAVDNTYCMYVTFASGGVNTYTVTATAGVGGAISPTGSSSYNAGTNATYQIVVNNCYQVSDVLVDGNSVGAINSYTFSNIQANHTISASFVQTTYTVSVTAGANGSISYGTVTIPAGSTQNITVNCGDQPTFTFHPNNGYQISDVLANSVSVGTPGSYQFPALSGNASLNVSFTQIPVGTFVITSSAGNGGTISPNGTNNFSSGASQTYTISPNTCYAIADVIVDGNSVGTPSSYTFNSIQANHSISVSFVQITYTVSVTVGANGSVSYGTVTIPAGSTQNVTVNCGDQPTFTFHPNNGYQVNDVLVNSTSVGTPASYQFTTLTANATLSVSFMTPATQNYTITSSAGPGGSITPAGTQTFSQGNNQNYTITPDNCYQISDVLVDGNSIGAAASYTFTNINANHTIVASFQAITYTIMVNVGTGGSVSYNGTYVQENDSQQFTVDCGTTPVFQFIPNSGNAVSDVRVNGNSVGNASQYQFPPMNGDVVLEVSFGPASAIQEYEHQILLAPNPAKQHLTVEAEGFTRLEVLNYLGQSIFATTIEQSKTVVDVKEFSNGIYFVRLSGEKGTATRKFIKE